MNDCLFCQIVQKRIPAKIAHVDEHTLAFDVVNPQAPVHVLIIPKQHVQAVGDVRETESGLLAQLLLTCTKVAKHKGLALSGYRIVTNTGPDAGQTVFHLHLHVLGGRHMTWPPG